MKKRFLFLIATSLIFNRVFSQSGNSCDSSKVFTSNYSCFNENSTSFDEMWFSFTATSTQVSFSLRNDQDTSSGHMHYLSFFSGGCSNLALIHTDSLRNSGDSIINLYVSGLILGNVYYLEAFRL